MPDASDLISKKTEQNVASYQRNAIELESGYGGQRLRTLERRLKTRRRVTSTDQMEILLKITIKLVTSQRDGSGQFVNLIRRTIFYKSAFAGFKRQLRIERLLGSGLVTFRITGPPLLERTLSWNLECNTLEQCLGF